MQFPSLADAFLTYFDVSLATTLEQREQVARMRYRVYCKEFGYENAEEFPDRLEVDEFDAYSLHCMVTHKRSGLTAGCVRLICGSESQVLPLEKYCLNSMYLEYMDALTSNPSNVCEFSRLAVDTSFRRRRGEDHTRIGEYDSLDCSHQERRTFSLIGIVSFNSAVVVASLNSPQHIIGMMELNVPRLLRRSGLLVEQAGDYMEYHGQRAPYYLSTEVAVDNMREDLRVLYDTIHSRLAATIQAQEDVA